MGKVKLFLIFSNQDAKVVTAFVNIMLTIELKSEDMISTSVPSTKISNGEDIFNYLNKTLSDEYACCSFRVTIQSSKPTALGT